MPKFGNELDLQSRYIHVGKGLETAFEMHQRPCGSNTQRQNKPAPARGKCKLFFADPSNQDAECLFVQSLLEATSDSMSPNSHARWTVGNCTADLGRQLLLRGGVPVKIRPKEWALLTELLRHPNALVNNTDLIGAIWPRQDVDPKQLVNVASGLRTALRVPGALQSIHRRGYLLCATPANAEIDTPDAKRPPIHVAQPAPAHFVGLDAELQALDASLSRALTRQCQVMEIRGAAGVGKSTLVQKWLAEVATKGGWTVLMGRAIDLASAVEPFGPLIQMLWEHARSADTDRVTQDLRRWAPCWLAQLPDLLNASQVVDVQAEVYRSGEGRMRREGVDLVCRWATEKPMVMVLEDVQWADAATLDFLALLSERARYLPLIMITTRRLVQGWAQDAEAQSAWHKPPTADSASIVTLRGFAPPDVHAYLRLRLPDFRFRDDQVVQLTKLTDGLPLFLRTIVDWLDPRSMPSPMGCTIEELLGSVVNQLNQLIVERAMSLSVDLRALVDVACCMPEPVPVPVLALVLEASEPFVEDRCQQLMRVGLFTAHPTLVPWKGERVVKAYGLAHSLYREALFGELPTSLLMTLSRRLAGALGPTNPSLSATQPYLSTHFAQLGMHQESAAALRMSSMRSLGRFSIRHAVRALQASLSHLQQAAPPSGTLAQQLETCWDLSRLLMVDHNATDDIVEAVRDSIIALAPKVNTARAEFVLQATLCARHIFGGRADLAQAPVEQLKTCSAHLGHHEQAVAHLWQGGLSVAMGRLDDGAAAYGACMALPLANHGLAGVDARTLATTHVTWGLAMKGQMAAFLASAQALEAEVHATRSAYLRIFVSFWIADAMRQLSCFDAARRRFKELLELCELHDSSTFRNQAMMGLLACAGPAQRDLAALQALSSEATGSRPHMGDHVLSIATLEGMIAQGLLDQASDLLRRTEQMDQHWPFYTPERLRLKGKLAHASGRTKQAQVFRQEALTLDLERGFLPGVLRHLEDDPRLSCQLKSGTDRSRLDGILRLLLGAELDTPDLQPLKAALDTIQLSLDVRG